MFPSLQLSASFTVSFQQLQEYRLYRAHSLLLCRDSSSSSGPFCALRNTGGHGKLPLPKGMSHNSLCPTTSTIHQSLCPFFCLLCHQESWVHGSDGIPDPIPACNQARLQLQRAAGSGKTVLNASSPRAGACPDVSWNGSGRPVAHRCLLA